MFATYGDVYFNNKKNLPHEIPNLGYCSQFDTFPNQLTALEILTLVGNLNGIKNVKLHVDATLKSLKLESIANKLTRYYRFNFFALSNLCIYY